MMRLFWTLETVAKLGPTYSNKCGTQIGNQSHTFWSNPKLRIFWKEVSKTPQEVFHQNITKDPKVALLGLPLEGIDGRVKKYLTNIANSSD